MEIRKSITVLVPSELIYLFDVDCDHLFVVARERGRIVARPAEELCGSKDCRHLVHACCNDCSSCKCYDDGFDTCRYYGGAGR